MIALADFKMGNIFSIKKALEQYYKDVRFTNDADEIMNAKALVIPGDGAFDQAMQNLNESGLLKVFDKFKSNGKPILGICIGFQILFESSEEGSLNGLGWFKGHIKKFKVKKKVPHMGWNKITIRNTKHNFLENLDSTYFYFIHSYYAEKYLTSRHQFDDLSIEAICQYDNICFPAIVSKQNVFATQFHPEKSFLAGLKIIENFCRSIN